MKTKGMTATMEAERDEGNASWTKGNLTLTNNQGNCPPILIKIAPKGKDREREAGGGGSGKEGENDESKRKHVRRENYGACDSETRIGKNCLR